ncbi:YkuS family protein [Clostridium folliculivorans]|uniref:YkuS family protein n=1 Tax=Clostridium folliculivorans TaxID=2886038 RepID=A0A9W5Y3A4_9CLOT|nr:YkuS family protein [Clostridium folliculivorans]GKU25828.1 hypothetical protein CFOLD11_26540 [Clostridium folliculivorans]GKU27914.1 hypothetical protein CFB3_00200 [Clostridium folliculivorans]
MNLYISDELKNLKSQLEKRGYKIVTCNEQYDAIICNLKEVDLSHLPSCKSYKSEGIVIIDSGSKNVDDIENILINRVYSAIL